MLSSLIERKRRNYRKFIFICSLIKGQKDLVRVRFDKMIFTCIAQLLQYNTHIILQIDLGRNTIIDEGAKAVAEAIKVNLMLEMISMSNNIGQNLISQIDKSLKEIRSTKMKN
jgi:hypothetical protein